MRTLLITSVLAASLAFAPAALADNVGISLSTSSPEQGIPVTVTASGSSGAIDSYGDGAYLYVVARPSGGVGCQASFGADQVAAGDASTVLIDGDEQDPGQTFSEQSDFTPDVGGSLVCAWLETDGDDGGDVATPNEVTAGPVASTFTAGAPQVGPLKVSVPATIKLDQAYDITYATQTDQDLSLDSIVIPTGGSGCAGSYELELSDLTNPDDIFGGSTDIYASASTTGIDKESTAGSYTICSWIEGPDAEQVDATSATPIKVLAAGASTGGSTSTSSAYGADPHEWDDDAHRHVDHLECTGGGLRGTQGRRPDAGRDQDAPEGRRLPGGGRARGEDDPRQTRPGAQTVGASGPTAQARRRGGDHRRDALARVTFGGATPANVTRMLDA